MLSVKIFEDFQILFVSQENDLGFSSDFEIIALNIQHQNSPIPCTHTAPIKIWHDNGAISGYIYPL